MSRLSFSLFSAFMVSVKRGELFWPEKRIFADVDNSADGWSIDESDRVESEWG